MPNESQARIPFDLPRDTIFGDFRRRMAPLLLCQQREYKSALVEVKDSFLPPHFPPWIAVHSGHPGTPHELHSSFQGFRLHILKTSWQSCDSESAPPAMRLQDDRAGESFIWGKVVLKKLTRGTGTAGLGKISPPLIIVVVVSPSLPLLLMVALNLCTTGHVIVVFPSFVH